MAEKVNLAQLKGELVELKEKEEELRSEFKRLVNRTANLVLEMIRIPVEECQTEKLLENAKKLNQLKKEILSTEERIKELEKSLEV